MTTAKPWWLPDPLPASWSIEGRLALQTLPSGAKIIMGLLPLKVRRLESWPLE